MARQQTRSAGAAAGGRQGRGSKPPAPATVIEATEKPAPRKPFDPVKFFREVRAEWRKITWTTRKETWITSVMVFIMLVVATVFFAVVDLVLGWGVSHLITVGR